MKLTIDTEYYVQVYTDWQCWTFGFEWNFAGGYSDRELRLCFGPLRVEATSVDQQSDEKDCV